MSAGLRRRRTRRWRPTPKERAAHRHGVGRGDKAHETVPRALARNPSGCCHGLGRNKSGSFRLNTYGAYGWGTYSGTSTSSTYVPGYLTTDTFTRPGYTLGYYYPTAVVAAFDARTFNNVWLATGAGTSTQSDARISSQFVITTMIAKFPPASEVDSPSPGVIGVALGCFTNDGNNYVPTILSAADDGPAKKAGVKQHDMLLSVGGQSVVNAPTSRVYDLLRGEPGTEVELEVWRLNKRVGLRITRVEAAAVY